MDMENRKVFFGGLPRPSLKIKQEKEKPTVFCAAGKRAVFFIVGLMLSINALKAQILSPYITLDPDGYTNIREQPNKDIH